MSASNSGEQVFGSTDNGFIPRQLADIQRKINEDHALITDPRTEERPFQNVSDDTIMQQATGIISEAVADVENAAAAAFSMLDPLTATGAGLAALVQLNAILKKEGRNTVIPVYLFGSPSAVIPQGSLVCDPLDTSIPYSLNETVVLPANGQAEALAICTEEGEHCPEKDTITYIMTPAPGWDDVTNDLATSVGTFEEGDNKLRRRQQLSTEATSYRQIEAIQAAVRNIEGVTFVRAYQNRKLVPDSRGLPGKSIAVVVVGGNDLEIAQAISYRDPAGMTYHGNTAVNITDEFGQSEGILFSRPTERLISARLHMEIVVDENVQKFPKNGEPLVKQAIVDFSVNGHSMCEPMGNDGFLPGQDIIREYLMTPINSIGGAKATKIELAVDGGEFEEKDVVIAWNEIGVFAVDRIEVKFP